MVELARLRAELENERAARVGVQSDLQICQQSLAALTLSETYFRHLTEYALDLITILDADGTIRFESRSIATELGYAPEDYIGRNAFEFVHPEDAPRIMQAFQHALETHGSTPLLSFRFRHKDGTYRILEGRGNNLLDDAAVAGIVFNSRDVTEQRRLEDQFRQSQKVQAIGQLTGGVAHDFNNILTAIIGYSELALNALPVESPQVGQVSEIRKAAHRAAALTRQLLAFSRKQVLQPRVIQLEAVITEMDKMLRRLLGEQIDFVTVTHGALGNVKADLGQIEQVLLNLAVNARDAMANVPHAKLTIELTNATLDAHAAALREEIAPGEYVQLSVTDNGCGMPPEVKARIFEPFFTTKPQGQGTGLGLATCQGIVKQSGGYLAVYSEIGVGTTFKVLLPRVNDEAEAVTQHAEKYETRCGTGTVLLVEDEPMLRELGLTVLAELGYDVLCAENGREALRLLQEHPGRHIDLLLTDVVMPEMGGKELATHIRERDPQTRVVFCSGYTEDAVFHNGSLEPGVFFLQKPYTISGIAQKLSEVLAVA